MKPPGTVRITGGTHRGRKLEVPEGRDVRPTSDRARQALFNILGHHEWRVSDGSLPNGARVLDAFAGTGALGLEALSRGAREVLFLENDKAARAVLTRNITSLDEAGRAFALPRDATRPGPLPGTELFTLMFMDAPYHSGLAMDALAAFAAEHWLAPHAVAVVELDSKEPCAPPPGFRQADDRVYGHTRLLFLEAEA